MIKKILLIVPPFQSIERPSIGTHIVKAQCKSKGIHADVLYLNLKFASILGFEKYSLICNSETGLMLGESMFTIPSLRDAALRHVEKHLSINYDHLYNSIEEFLSEVKSISINSKYDIVACSSLFQQNNSSLTVLSIFKNNNEQITTVIGGGGCESGQVMGLKALADCFYSGAVDYFFSGESENDFVQFVKENIENKAHEFKESKIIYSEKPSELETLPILDYSEYFSQAALMKEGITTSLMWLPLETSRGCWWARKSHCTFCALNLQPEKYRTKSISKIVDETLSITAQNYTKRVWIIDNILPINYLEQLFPLFENHNLSFYMEHKVPLSYKNAKIIQKAGVIAIQPGIETMSKRLLKLMRKGTHPGQNIELLRHCKIFGMNAEWNFLYGVPNEDYSDYEEMTSFLPYIEHLNPPATLSKISIEKYSPYHNHSGEYGIENVNPVESYKICYPKVDFISDIFTSYTAEYPCVYNTHPDIFNKFAKIIGNWKQSWKFQQSQLEISMVNEEMFLIKDTRSCSKVKWLNVDRGKAASTISKIGVNEIDKSWAINYGFALEIDGMYIPLATCHPNLYDMLIDKNPDEFSNYR